MSIAPPPPSVTGTSLDATATSHDIEKSEGMVEIDYEPFLADKKFNKTSPPAFLTLIEAHKTVYQEVFKHFSAEDFVIPDFEDGDGKLTEEERYYLSYECFLRFLRASKWNATNCIKRLEAALKWRRQYGIYDTLTLESIKEHCLKGKVFVFGYNAEGRPGFFDFPERYSTPEGPGRIRLYVWMMERAVDIMPRGVESISALIFLTPAAPSASFPHSKQMFHTLESYYPEHLGLSVINNAPFWLTIIMKLVDPFLDPVTRSKIAINRQIIAEGDFSPDQMLKEWGGEREFAWDCDRYLYKLAEIALKMKEKRFAKWRELGGQVGLREWDYKEE